MKKQKTQSKSARKRYSSEYKVKALALVEKAGVAAAAITAGRTEGSNHQSASSGGFCSISRSGH